MSALSAVFVVAHLTFAEARRRRILAAALVFGLAFVLLFAVGLFFIAREVRSQGPAWQQAFALSFAVMAGLYAANTLVAMTSALIAVDTLAGEISSGVVETLCTKPVPRAAVALGKWLGCWALLLLYAALLFGGVLLVGWCVAGYVPDHAGRGFALVVLEGTVLLTLALLGGSRLSTLANGIAVFGLHGLAFVGSWMEQIGTIAGNQSARSVGIVASLLVPTESLWQLAAHGMQLPVARDVSLGPFSPASVPSPAMVGWALGYVAVMLLLALRSFSRRDL